MYFKKLLDDQCASSTCSQKQVDEAPGDDVLLIAGQATALCS
jgi:hypothetical protein